VVREWLVEVITEIPADAEPVGGHPKQVPLRADALEEHHELEPEEHDRVDARASIRRIAVLHPGPHETQVKRRVRVAIEVVRRHEVLD
jgi:hypothetical protein